MEAFKNGPFDLIYNRKVAQQITNHHPSNPRQQWLVKRCNLKLPVRTGDAHVTTQNSFVEAVNSAGAQAVHCSKHVYDFDTKTTRPGYRTSFQVPHSGLHRKPPEKISGNIQRAAMIRLSELSTQICTHYQVRLMRASDQHYSIR